MAEFWGAFFGAIVGTMILGFMIVFAAGGTKHE